MQKAGRVATILALCLSIGLHWAALQSFAWTTMLIEYAKDRPLRQAIEQTFDGKHPCQICKGISLAQHVPKRQSVQVTVNKLDLICATRSFRFVRHFEYLEYTGQATVISLREESPPVPPPRLALS